MAPDRNSVGVVGGFGGSAGFFRNIWDGDGGGVRLLRTLPGQPLRINYV